MLRISFQSKANILQFKMFQEITNIIITNFNISNLIPI